MKFVEYYVYNDGRGVTSSHLYPISERSLPIVMNRMTKSECGTSLCFWLGREAEEIV